MRVRFGDCTFDADTRELFRGGEAIHLSPKAFRFLELLLENRPRALSKDELYRSLWPDTFVSEANLATLATEIRRAIGDDARRPRALRTVYGFGYAFSGEASEEKRRPEEGNRFFLVRDKAEIPLAEGENVVGREHSLPARIHDTTISRHHARIVIVGNDAVIEDLGSKNGTLLGGRRIDTPCRLDDGDAILFGSVLVTFRSLPPDTTTVTVQEK